MRRRSGFTLVELIVVIVIVLVLAGLIVPVLVRSRIKGLETKCMNNLKQIGTALVLYRDSNMRNGRELHPLRLTSGLIPHYIPNADIFLCPLDKSYGTAGGKPPKAQQQFEELDEPGLSYMYEFCMAAECSWGWRDWLTLPTSGSFDAFIDLDGEPTSKWGEVKAAQMRYGDKFLNPNYSAGNPASWSNLRGYPPTRFPVLRCFWHTDDPDTNSPDAILNLAYQGNVFRSGAKWEEQTLNVW